MRVFGLYLVLLLVCVSSVGVLAGGAVEAAHPRFKDQAQVLERFKSLQEEGKKEEALAVVNQGLEQFAMSMDLIRAKYGFLAGEKRWHDCIVFLDEIIPHLSPDGRLRARGTKAGVFRRLMEDELKAGNSKRAFGYLKQMADSGYRGNHQLRRNSDYESLRSMPGFAGIMDKIAENAGVGLPAKDFTSPLLTGGSVTLSELRGRVVLIDFWSTACKPCVEEMENLKKIYAAHRDRGFEIVGISFDQDRAKLERFVEEKSLPWPVVFSGEGWGEPAARLYNIQWIPSMWLVDRDGILRHFDHRGSDLAEAVKKLINQ